MRIFGSDRISGLMQKLGMEEGVPIEHGMVTRAIERAQKQVEAQNFSVRKHLLEYDDVMNKQRENVYALRREILEGRIRLDEEGDVVGTRDYLMSLAEDILDVAGRDVRAARGGLRAVGSRRAQARGQSRLRRRRRSDAGLRRPDRGRDSRCAVGRGFTAPTRRKRSSSAATCCERVERDIMLQIVDTPVEGSPLQPRPPERRHRPARLRPARSARRIQERELRALPGDEGARRRGDRALPVAARGRC